MAVTSAQTAALRLRGNHEAGTGTSSATATEIQTQTRVQPILHLRGAPSGTSSEVETTGSTGNGRRIQWASDVVDNEGMGRKKSKVCCIYHAPKGIDESSDESSSDSDNSSSDDDTGAARHAGGRKKECAHGHGHGHGKGKGKANEKKMTPNAYEKVPRSKDDGGSYTKS